MKKSKTVKYFINSYLSDSVVRNEMEVSKTVFNKQHKGQQKNIRAMRAEVTIEGTAVEILHEMNGILKSMENECPDILLKALQMHMEDR